MMVKSEFAISKERLLLQGAVCMGSVLLCMLNFTGKAVIPSCLVLLCLSFSNLYRVRNNLLLVAIYGVIAYCNYSIVFANHVLDITSIFTSLSGSLVDSKGIGILLVFSLCLWLFLPKEIGNLKLKPLSSVGKKNFFVIAGVLAALCLIFVVGFGRPDKDGERGTPTTFYEYSIVLFIVGFYYSRSSKLTKAALTFLMILYAAQNFVFGGRITGLQVIICFVLCELVGYVNFRKLIIPASIGFVLLSLIGGFRASAKIDISSIITTIEILFDRGFALDTAYSSYYTSLTFLGSLDFTSFSKRMEMLLKWLLSIILGGNAVPGASVPNYTRQYFVHYFGGVLPFYGYFYLGFFGVVLFAIWVSLLTGAINRLEASSHFLYRCMATYVSCTAFRWYLYSPSQITRGVLIVMAVYFVGWTVDGILAGRFVVHRPRTSGKELEETN